jgi:hypothetical protein
MTRRLVALLLGASAIAALGLTSAAPAGADGDPASDVLLSQDVFLPYSQISTATERRLYAVCDAARRSGYPLKIALIASRSDLGVVPALFGRPQAYAQFLSSELTGVVRSPILVVMPAGFGLAREGRPLNVGTLAGIATAGAGATAGTGAGADALATTAVSAVTRLAGGAGHPLDVPAAATGAPGGASATTVRHALIAIVVLMLLAGAAISIALTQRQKRM